MLQMPPAESLRSVTEIAAKSSSTTGAFADSIDALTLNLQNLGNEGDKVCYNW